MLLFSSLSLFCVNYLLSCLCEQSASDPTTSHQLNDLIKQAFQKADGIIAARRKESPVELPSMNSEVEEASEALNYFQASTPRSMLFDSIQERFEEASKILTEESELDPLPNSRVLQKALKDNTVRDCQALFSFTCDERDRYRTFDGTCNNLENPSWGMAASCFVRLLPANYADGISEFRKSVTGRPLPNPRNISVTIHNDRDKKSRELSHLFMQFGQFLTHDISLTPLSRDSANNKSLKCCPIRSDAPKQCAPIPIPKDDPFYSSFDIGCLGNVRSARCATCSFGPRQQINQVTSFIDGSLIYGSDLEESISLRAFRKGRLKVQSSSSGDLLPKSFSPDTDVCSHQIPKLKCFQTGDTRVNQHPLLTAMYTVFVRYHNHIAGSLANVNKHWDDERIFHVARRIVGAAMQVITYEEYLPLVIGRKRMSYSDLSVKRTGYSSYDPDVNPMLLNEFSVAALRFGHSMVNTNNTNPPENSVGMRLRDLYLYPFVLYSGMLDEIVRGMTKSPSQMFDRWMVEDVTNQLNKVHGGKAGLDLASLNVIRGRDHGMPPYVVVARRCTGLDIKSFKDLGKLFEEENVKLLRSVYRSVEDIDFFTGGLAEKLTCADAVIGPTFSCIVEEQFRRLKFGDRFHFEHGGQKGSFTPAQLQELRKINLARIFCRTTNVLETQRFPLFLPNTENPRLPCSVFPEINFKMWSE